MPRHERRLIEPNIPIYPHGSITPHPRLFRNEIVYNYRVLRNWTQEIAAQHHGVSARTWQRYEQPSCSAPTWLLKQIHRWAHRACPENLRYLSS